MEKPDSFGLADYLPSLKERAKSARGANSGKQQMRSAAMPPSETSSGVSHKDGTCVRGILADVDHFVARFPLVRYR